MNCQDTRELVHGYIDGELDLMHNVEIERHLRECATCAELYEGQQALRSAVRDRSLYFRAPQDLRQRVQQAVRREAGGTAQARVIRWPARRRWLTAAASIAAAVTLAVGLRPVLFRPSSGDLLAQQVLASHVRSLMASHLTDVPSSDQHTVKPWFNGKLDFSPPVKDLAAQGFPLAGGRLDYLDNRPVAALVYQRRKHFINLFIWPVAGGSATGGGVAALQGYHLIHWNQSGMNYWAVSDVNAADLEQFTRLIRE
ncbi:MAG TPA: anti-sigma factor [Bryobacterales bacterium]|nr:anti-sigma factor [Bryobacterales bacterium]